MGVADSIASALGGNIATGIADIVRLFKVDPNLALQHQVELEQIQASMQNKIIDSITAQTEVNKAEAMSGKMFLAGWRPMVGWACASAFIYNFVFQPLAVFVITASNSTFDPKRLPALDSGTLMTVLFGMLGIAGARTYEKIKGVDSLH
jgi:roadblock/LC7 domain-containing protein